MFLSLFTFFLIQSGSRERVHLADLDAKHNNILTFRELEAFACFGTSRFLTLYGARVACHEAFRTESGFVFGIDLHQSAGDGETKSLGLSFVTAAVEVGVDVVFLNAVESRERLLYDILKN